MREHMRLMARIVIIVAKLVAAVVASGAVWMVSYPDAHDPKGPRYVLWKAGIFNMDLDLATDAMVGDAGRAKLVVGLTRQQLSKRFGYLKAPAEASAYLRDCYKASAW